MKVGKIFVATAVALSGLTAGGAGPASAAAPPPAFHPFNAVDVGSSPASTAIGDLTGDGRPDVLMSTAYANEPAADHRIWLFPQQADGTLGAPTSYLTGAAYGDDLSLEIADLDGDGDNDAAVATSDGIEIHAQEAGALAFSWTVPAPGARQVEAADLTGDGLADLVVRSNQGIRAFRQINGDFMTLAAVSSTSATDIEVGDVSGDGAADVVAVAGAAVAVHAQAADGTFLPAVSYPTGGTAPWAYANGLAVGDLTGDGLTDVAVTMGGNSPNGKVGILAQQTDGSLAPAEVHASYDIPETAEAADVNADGLTDLVVLHGGWLRAGVYVQQDDGTLSGEDLYAIPYASHYDPDGLAVGDVTGDGRADLAIGDYNYGLVMLRSAGPGSDVTPPDTVITGGPSGTIQTRTATFSFASTEPGSFECRLDAAAWASCTSPRTYTGLSAGSHTFHVRSVDTAGNVDPSPALRTVTVTGPDTTITSGPTGTVRSTTATFELAGAAGTTGFECSIDSGAYSSCTSPVTYSVSPGASHVFRVRAVGAEGLVDATPAQRQWTVEAAADLAVSLAVPSSVKASSLTSYTLTIRNTGPAGATGVTSTQGLPAGLALQSVASTTGTCSASGSPATIRCSVGEMAAGATATVTVTVKATARNNTVLTSTAVVSSTSWDPDSSDDSASATTKVAKK